MSERIDKRYAITRYLAGDPNSGHNVSKGYMPGNFIRNLLTGELFYTVKEGVHRNFIKSAYMETETYMELDDLADNIELADGEYNYWHGQLVVRSMYNEAKERVGIYQYVYDSSGRKYRNINLASFEEEGFPEWQTSARVDNPYFIGTITVNGKELNTGNASNYLMVYGIGTPEENAAEFLAAYEEAKLMPRYLGQITIGPTVTIYKGQSFFISSGGSPYNIATEDFTGIIINCPKISTIENVAKSIRTTIIVAPGKYEFDETFTMDTEYIDIVSLTGNSDVIINGMHINTDNVYVKGFDSRPYENGVTNRITLLGGKDNVVVENCKGGDYSFYTSDLLNSLKGTFINCTGADYCFCSEYTAIEAKFINCIGNNYCFGSKNTLDENDLDDHGEYLNCIGNNYCFGTGASIHSYGIFDKCKGNNYCFGGNSSSVPYGTYKYCEAGTNSFGGESDGQYGSYYYCKAVADSGLADSSIKLFCIENNAIVV